MDDIAAVRRGRVRFQWVQWSEPKDAARIWRMGHASKTQSASPITYGVLHATAGGARAAESGGGRPVCRAPVPNAATLSIGGSIGPDRKPSTRPASVPTSVMVPWASRLAFPDRVTRSLSADHCGSCWPQADVALFRQRQSESMFSIGRLNQIGVRIAWPVSLIHTAKNEKVRILQARLQRPQMQPRMPSIAGRTTRPTSASTAKS